MSKESYFALAFALVAILMVVLQMIYPEIPPYIGLPIVALLGVGAIILVVRGIIKGKKTLREDKTSSQIRDLEMGKHITRIRELLTIFKNELLAKVSEKGHVSNLQVNVEKQRGFYQVWEHCPSIKKVGFDLRLSRILYEAKLKSNSVVAEDDSHIKERMKALADAIDDCLSDGEYLVYSCSNCIEKRNQLSSTSKASNPASAQSKEGSQSLGDGIQPKSYDKRDVIISNEESLVLTPHTYAIGLSGMTGYPDKPANAYWLCLKVTVHPSSKPIDTLDLLIGATTIPANDWPGKNVTAFSVYFNVTGWKWKGEIRVELQARIQGVVHSSGRIPIDFNVEPGGSHRI